MKKMFIFGLLLVFCGLSAAAQDKKDALAWQTGKILDNQYVADVKIWKTKEYDISKPMTDPDYEKPKNVPMRDDTETIKIQAGDLTYTLTRKLKYLWHPKLKLDSGSDINFALDGQDYMYLKNAKGKKIKYYIAKIVNKRDEAGN